MLHLRGDAGLVDVYLLAKEGGVFHFLSVGDKGQEGVLLVLDGGDALGKGDASCLGAIDGYGNGIVSMEVVVHPFDDDTLHPHEHGGNEEGDYDTMGGCHGAMGYVFVHKREHDCEQCSNHSGKSNTLEVDEGGVSDYAFISAEDGE